MKTIATILIALAASVSFAEKKAAVSSTAKPAAKVAAQMKMDVEGKLKWTGYGVGKSHSGDIAIKSGHVEMKGEELVGGTFVLDMKTMTTADSPKLEGHLKSPDFFDVEKFNEGSFKITKVEMIAGAKAGEATHKITGDLTIKGQTHPQTILTTLKKVDKAYAATGTTEIEDRTQYDIKYNSGKFKAISALGDKLIKDNITISLDVKTK